MNRRKPRAIATRQHRADHDAARDVVGMHQVKRASEQQAGCEACLRAESLLVQEVGQARRRVQVQTAAGGDERKAETAQQGQQYPHRTAVNQGPVPKSSRFIQRSGVKLKDRSHCRSQANRQDIQEYPEFGRAASGPRGSTRGARFPFGRQRQGRRQPLPKIRTCHRRNADLKFSSSAWTACY